MSDISTSRLIGDTGNQSGSALIQWMFSPVVLSVFLAFMIGTTFFISEHSLVMSKNLSENFVAEIEDQESWADGGNKFRQISFLSCAAVGALSLIFGRAGNFRVNLPVLLVIAYILWAGASATWSLDRGTTVRRYILVLCCCIGCLGFSRFLSVKDAVFAAMLVSAVRLHLTPASIDFRGQCIRIFRPPHWPLAALRRTPWPESNPMLERFTTAFSAFCFCSWCLLNVAVLPVLYR